MKTTDEAFSEWQCIPSSEFEPHGMALKRAYEHAFDAGAKAERARVLGEAERLRKVAVSKPWSDYDEGYFQGLSDLIKKLKEAE